MDRLARPHPAFSPSSLASAWRSLQAPQWIQVSFEVYGRTRGPTYAARQLLPVPSAPNTVRWASTLVPPQPNRRSANPCSRNNATPPVLSGTFGTRLRPTRSEWKARTSAIRHYRRAPRRGRCRNMHPVKVYLAVSRALCRDCT